MPKSSARTAPIVSRPGPDRQRLAAATAALRRLAIIAGGPGTGKTTTVARIVALLRGLAPATVALAAPTGKAAARLQEAVATALQGMDPADGIVRAVVRIDAASASAGVQTPGPVPARPNQYRCRTTWVIVDETSMVSLPMMARLLEAVRPDARLILVETLDQLASIDAGAVLGDLVGSPADEGSQRVGRCAEAGVPGRRRRSRPGGCERGCRPDRNYCFSAGAIAGLAAAIRAGDADQVLEILQVGHDDAVPDPSDPATAELVRLKSWRRPGRLSRLRQSVMRLWLSPPSRHTECCARTARDLSASATGTTRSQPDRTPDRAQAAGDPWYGRPLLVTVNDYTADPTTATPNRG